MSELPAEQTALDRFVVDAVFDVVPEDWRAFQLTVEPVAGGAPRLSVVNPDVAGAESIVSDELRLAVTAVIAYLAREKRPWDKLTYAGRMGEKDEWRLRIIVPIPPAPAPPTPNA